MIQGSKRVRNVLFSMRSRDRALLRWYWKEINTTANHVFPHFLIGRKRMVRCEVVPVQWCMVHEIDTQCRSLPRNRQRQPGLPRDFLDAVFHDTSEPLNIIVDLAVVLKQAFYCSYSC